ncbi:hypothetical protein DL96DRAFT_1592615 [Flagelloscypha sp. PMI_526]|nr:hypothetical protein DL96DRAFT_1592615 [Flagelloscypha sp. PMI_526]
MYQSAAFLQSTTSLESDVDIDDGHALRSKDVLDDHESLPVVLSPAQWSHSRGTSLPAVGPIGMLPPELLIHILRHLHAARDLFTCLGVCREWCQCAVELLWHKPVFTKFDTLAKMTRLLASPVQSFTYALFVRRLNFLSLGKTLRDEPFYTIANCSRLERLTLVNCDHLTPNSLIKVLPSFPTLVAVDLSGVTSTPDAAIVGLAVSARRLQGINLTGCKDVTDVGILALAHNCPLLRRVKLSGLARITDEPISDLAKHCPLLLEIDLNKCLLITDIAIRDIWTYSTHMREMRLAHCSELTDSAFPSHLTQTHDDLGVNPFTNPSHGQQRPADDDLPPLIIQRSFEHLRMLDLTACALVTDDGIQGIISHAPKIRHLVLSKCSLLTDRALDSICTLGRHLHYLHIGHASRITDKSVRNLARSCTRLRYVDFASKHNCTLLTDMSVFELAGLTKLRRIGLVRVNRLTDEAIYALARRHNTLERIHLSYCDQITVMAIYFLLQKLHKLTHLSLTGVPAFRQQQYQQFCREPPKEFNEQQQAAFCVYSGKGVAQLRAFLAELYDHITEMNGVEDTEFEEEDTDPEPFKDEELGDVDDDAMDDLPTRIMQRLTIPGGYSAYAAHNSIPVPVPNTGGPAGPNRYQTSSAPSASRSQAFMDTDIPSRTLADVVPVVEPSFSLSSAQEARTTRGIPTPDLNFAEIGHSQGTGSHHRIPPAQLHEMRRDDRQRLPRSRDTRQRGHAADGGLPSSSTTGHRSRSEHHSHSRSRGQNDRARERDLGVSSSRYRSRNGIDLPSSTSSLTTPPSRETSSPGFPYEEPESPPATAVPNYESGRRRGIRNTIINVFGHSHAHGDGSGRS